MFDTAPFDFWAILGLLALAIGLGLLFSSDNDKIDEFDCKYGASGKMYCEP